MPSKKSSHRAIDAIIFDLGKVIVDYDHGLMCSRLARADRLDPELVRAAIFDSGLEDRFDRGAVSPEDFYRLLVQSTGLTISLQQTRTIWTTIFTPIAGTMEIIRSLPGYRLFCLSNTNRWHFDYCRNTYAVMDLFEGCILSCEVGARKPEPEIFQAALERAQVPPQRCLFIDDVELFVRGARSMGLHGIRFSTPDHLQQQLRELGISVPEVSPGPGHKNATL
jgi:glucose-1-phosphatase